MKQKIFFYFCVPFFISTTFTLKMEENEEILSQSLLKNYNKYIRGKTVVGIELKMQLKQIVEINERSQVITTHFHLTQRWIDERLRWNPQHYDNLSTLVIPLQKIWFPDLFILNTADPDGYINVKEQSFASLNYDGYGFFASPAQIRTRCALNMINFPFDKQKCIIEFASWINSINRAGMSKSSFYDLSEFINNSLWDLSGLQLRQIFIRSKNPYESQPAVILQLDINVKRKPLYYMVNGVMPCFRSIW